MQHCIYVSTYIVSNNRSLKIIDEYLNKNVVVGVCGNNYLNEGF
jgi:hypothetical protein